LPAWLLPAAEVDVMSDADDSDDNGGVMLAQRVSETAGDVAYCPARTGAHPSLTTTSEGLRWKSWLAAG